MAEFLNPFSGLAPDKKMTLPELIRAIRLSIAAEEEAIHLYTAQADATDHPLAKKFSSTLLMKNGFMLVSFYIYCKFLLRMKTSSWRRGNKRWRRCEKNCIRREKL